MTALSRREMLALSASLAVSAASQAAPEPRGRMGVVIHSYGIRRSNPSRPDRPRFDDPCDFLEHCASLGASGIQTSLGRAEASAAKLHALAEKHGMYVEGIVGLPREEADVARFEAELRTAKEAGARVVRTVASGERRYERFDSAEAFREFVRKSWDALRRAEPIVAHLDMRLAVENHKDWRIEELLDILQRLSSKHVGICLDTGNSIALLEDPLEVVKAYAPWTFTTHFKDMGLAEYPDGFLLSEVVLGEGILNLKEAVRLIHDAHPEARLNLEMITRDPLKVPCLTPKYWATFERVAGKDLAATLRQVRAKTFPHPLPTVTGRNAEERIRIEEENVRRCLQFAKMSW